MTALRELRWRVEHVDTDAAGVVHFTRYASLLESALLENLDRLGWASGTSPRKAWSWRYGRCGCGTPPGAVPGPDAGDRPGGAGRRSHLRGVRRGAPGAGRRRARRGAGQRNACALRRRAGQRPGRALPSALRRALSDWKREIGTEGDRDD
ncbi:hypothetical protein NKG94_26990 [Micromonospora sp. M12]